MISRSFSSRNPDAAAAQPEYEFSIETTTGMSPPPIEATRCAPRTSAVIVTATSSHSAGAITNHVVSTVNAARAPRLRWFLPGSISGDDEIRPESLRNATIEPVKVTAPMKTPMNTSAEWIPSSSWTSSTLASALTVPFRVASTWR